jgi:uncharacterized protein (TIGR02588 family)
MAEERQAQDHRGKREIPMLEWIASGLGLVFVIGSASAILYYAADQDLPPRLRAEAMHIASVPSGFLVQVAVHNDGGAAAAAVTVEGSLQRDGKTIDEATTTFDYVPAHSTANGGLVFSHDPRRHQLELEANAYMDP